MATLRNSKVWLKTFAFAVALSARLVLQGQAVDLEKQTWIHGSSDCRENKDVPLQVVRFDQSTYIIRQNKCLNYEAPFLYLFIGTEKALLIDTGAEAPDGAFPLYETIKKILKENNRSTLPLVVVHSHGHGDHYAGDYQFNNKHGVQLIPPTKDAVVDFFQLQNWPDTQKSFDLGKRELIIIPIPGHDQLSIAVYDPQTRWLLTGDTIYPGRLYVRDGEAFRSSIARLHAFAKDHPISFIMGNHIEMTKTKGVDYPTGTLYQPNEHQLPLGLSALEELYRASERMGNKVVYEIHDKFIIVPK
jgi:hydroxyacylglutathione hydrolase